MIGLFKINIRWILFAWALLFFTTAAAFSSPESDQDPINPRGIPLSIIAAGPYGGNFSIRDDGSRGLASMVGYAKMERARKQKEGGALFFVQVGDLTGTRDSESFLKKIQRPGFSFRDSTGFQAMHVSPREFEFIQQTPGSYNLPLVHYQVRDPHPSRDIQQYRIFPTGSHHALITGISNMEGEDLLPDPISSFGKELKTQTGVDLFIILVSETPDVLDSPNLFDPEELEFQKRLFLYDPKFRDPVTHDPWPEVAARTILIQPSSRPGFRRLESGAYLCTVDSTHACQIDTVFRNHRLIQIHQRFIDINSQERTYRRVPPQKDLKGIYNQPPSQDPEPLRFQGKGKQK